jgi:hypothetical protein
LSRIALLPLDDRPVNYDHPWWLARAAGLELSRPPREWLGNPFRDAARDRLAEWLQEEASTADALIVAVDTLAYGGLIPSRRSATALADITVRLEPLRVVRSRRPSLLILGFSVLMRVNRSNDAEEEKPYWADHGRDLFRLSYLDDKSTAGDASADEAAELSAVLAKIPPPVISDYRGGRVRNHAINRLVLDWSADGVLDIVVIAQDDTAPYGWNIAEARGLRDDIRRNGLADRASVYPGADEVGTLLVAAAACHDAGFAPRVWPRYSGVDGSRAVTAYEDRPVEELLKAHLGPLGGSLATGPDEANVVLAINAPGEVQAEAWLQSVVPGASGGEMASVPKSVADRRSLRAVQREMVTTRRDVDEFARAIEADMARGRIVGVVDIAYVNGADLALAERLEATVPLARLAAYGAWNTAGNSLGSALAQATVRAIGTPNDEGDAALGAHLSLLFTHLVDDYAYQGQVRTALMLEDLPDLGLAPSFHRLPDDRIADVEQRLGRRLDPYVASLGHLLGAHAVSAQDGPDRVVAVTAIEPPVLPWRRLFEIGLEPHLQLR